MLSLFRSFFSWGKKQPSKQITVMLIGLDNSGKTTLLSAIQGNVDHETMPTVGFDREVISDSGFTTTYFDLGGGAQIRSIWASYYVNVHAAIFVVDASDEKRLDEARDTLQNTLSHDHFKGKSLLVFANKQDLPNALPPSAISERLQLHALSIPYNIIGIQAKTDKGKPTDSNIKVGLKWLQNGIAKDFVALDQRVQMETKKEDERKAIERREKFKRIKARKEAREAEEARQAELAKQKGEAEAESK